MINEIQRKTENEIKTQDLFNLVEDWRGYDMKKFGDLLLDEKLMMVRKDQEKFMHFYLFEEILVCLKEIPKKEKRTFSIPLARKSNDMPQPGRRRSSSSFQFKGGVALASMQGVVASSKNN